MYAAAAKAKKRFFLCLFDFFQNPQNGAETYYIRITLGVGRGRFEKNPEIEEKTVSLEKNPDSAKCAAFGSNWLQVRTGKLDPFGAEKGVQCTFFWNRQRPTFL